MTRRRLKELAPGTTVRIEQADCTHFRKLALLTGYDQVGNCELELLENGQAVSFHPTDVEECTCRLGRKRVGHCRHWCCEHRALREQGGCRVCQRRKEKKKIGFRKGEKQSCSTVCVDAAITVLIQCRWLRFYRFAGPDVSHHGHIMHIHLALYLTFISYC